MTPLNCTFVYFNVVFGGKGKFKERMIGQVGWITESICNSLVKSREYANTHNIVSTAIVAS